MFGKEEHPIFLSCKVTSSLAVCYPYLVAVYFVLLLMITLFKYIS
jgi:hypothetical protein